ncbi:MAG: hypothetical protein Q8P76_00350 [bacterium]|nr:hypothetical protein [bacterium]
MIEELGRRSHEPDLFVWHKRFALFPVFISVENQWIWLRFYWVQMTHYNYAGEEYARTVRNPIPAI